MTKSGFELHTYLQDSLLKLEEKFHLMTDVIGRPLVVQSGSSIAFRYSEQTDNHVCFLKGVKLISTLNAALVLMRNGFAQEVNALCRIADEICNEVIFLLERHPNGQPTNDQVRFVEDFFKEEFSDVTNPLGSSQKRGNIAQRKIHASTARMTKTSLNPSDAQQINTVIHRALSGYVHGAYPHVMELYGGKQPCFHMRGMAGTVREMESTNQIINYVYRAIMIAELIAVKLGSQGLKMDIRRILTAFEAELQCQPHETPEVLVHKLKRKDTP